MSLAVAETIAATRAAVAEARQAGQRIGLVPTMGALHAGHLSLIEAAQRETDFVVVSIFVNPSQFGPNEDYTRYPRTFDEDLRLCREAGAALVFAPEARAIYPPGYSTWVEVEKLSDGLCGAARPGHFRGVATVVLKLFNIVQPDVAYFGQKDAQQARLIAKLVQDLDLPLQVRICPIVREPDGLALSSRNRYLDPEQRAKAVVLSQSLDAAEQAIAKGERNAASLQQFLRERINSVPGVELDYAEVVDAATLQPLEHLAGEVLLAVAARLGRTRLIDNHLVRIP